jgi:pyruvate kinase
MALYRDVEPMRIDVEGLDRDQVLHLAEQRLVDEGLVVAGDRIVLTVGEPIGQSGGTNTMKIVQVSAKPARG